MPSYVDDAKYPSEVVTTTGLPERNTGEVIEASHMNAVQKEVIRIEESLGLGYGTLGTDIAILLGKNSSGTNTDYKLSGGLAQRLSDVDTVLDSLRSHRDASSGVHGLSGVGNVVVGTSATQTLTNKSISGSSNTLTNIGYSSIPGLQDDLDDKQPLDGDLTSIAGLTGTLGFLKKTGANSWELDTTSYIAGNQQITISGDVSGFGATSITATLASTGVSAGTYNDSATQTQSLTVDAKGRVTGVGSLTTITPAWSSITSTPTTIDGYGITDGGKTSLGLNQFASTSANNLRNTISGTTGTGDLVFATTPTFSGPIFSSITNGAATLTLPTSTDTLVGRNTSDTLTNKILTSPTVNSPTITTPTISSGNITVSAFTTAGYVKNNSSGVLSSSSAIPQSDVTNLVSNLAAKAPLASPTFTGTVTVDLGAGFVRTNASGVLSSSAISTSDLPTITVAKGGTGNTSLTTYRILLTGTTSTGDLRELSAGTAGQVLSSNGSGVDPSWINATTTNTANALVKRDASGKIATEEVNVYASSNLVSSITSTYTNSANFSTVFDLATWNASLNLSVISGYTEATLNADNVTISGGNPGSVSIYSGNQVNITGGDSLVLSGNYINFDPTYEINVSKLNVTDNWTTITLGSAYSASTAKYRVVGTDVYKRVEFKGYLLRSSAIATGTNQITTTALTSAGPDKTIRLACPTNDVSDTAVGYIEVTTTGHINTVIPTGSSVTKLWIDGLYYYTDN